MQNPGVDFSKFVDEELAENGFRAKQLTKELMHLRLLDISSVINDTRFQYSDLYGWKKENKEYFLLELPGKWQYSYIVLNQNDEICMVCINSLKNGDSVHFHSVYVEEKFRNRNLTKYVLIRTAQTAIENGIEKLSLYCHRKNHSAFSLYYKSGFRSKSNGNDDDILMVADSKTVRDLCYNMIIRSKKG